MKKLALVSTMIGLFFTSTPIFSKNVTQKILAIFFDIETIFYTNKMRASGYIGKINSLRYASHVGHLPSQEDLFKQLKPLKAKSTEITYNNNLEMPLIFSDWLLATESSTKIKDTIQKYFANKDISEIEKKVLFAIVSMMLTPQDLADTQEVNAKIIKVIEKLKQQNVKIFLTGNWANITSLKMRFSEVFGLFNNVFMSGDLHLLKPSARFYQTVLTKSGMLENNCVWIESEPKFITQARKCGLNTISCPKDNHDSLLQGLRTLGFSV